MPADLILAAKICSEENIGKFGIMDTWRVLRLEENHKEFHRLLGIFSKYVMVEHWPKFWEKDEKNGGNSNGLPWPMAIIANLISNGIPEKRAWEMPECQAIWMNTAFGIRNGAKVSIMTPEEEAFMDSEIQAVANAAKVEP
jgi:hypothetical protein